MIERDQLISIKRAAELLGVCIQTLRRWDDEGKLKAIRTLGGHRRYNLSKIREMRQDAKE